MSLLEVSRPLLLQFEFAFVSYGIHAGHHTYFQKTYGCLLLVLKMHPRHVPNFSLKYVAKTECQIEVSPYINIFFKWTQET